MQGIVWTAILAVVAIFASVCLAVVAYFAGDNPLLGVAGVIGLGGLTLAILAWRAP